jgi:uncharacterized protein YecT (DUF1311 family)
MSECAARAASRADAKLEKLLAELERALDPEALKEMHAIQSRWRTLRDRDCRWEADLVGSVGPVVNAYCRAFATNARIDRLKPLLCEGAGMTGPCEASRRY